MIKVFQVYKQVFKFKVSHVVVGPKDYLHRDGVFVGKIHAVSKPDAADLLKELINEALSQLEK